MKVEVIKEEITERTYPYLGESKQGVVVLFYSRVSGTVLKADDDSIFFVGEHCSSLREDNFTPLEGKITLQND